MQEIGILLTIKNQIDAGLKSAKESIKSLDTAIGKLGEHQIAFSAISAGGLLLGRSMVKAASDAEETKNKFKQVFREQTADAEAYVQNLRKTLGRSTTEMRDSLSAYQAFAVGLGLNGEVANKFSQELNSMALDFSSFFNTTEAEANQRFISALSGSGEVLDKFGINIKEGALKMKLLEMGIEGGTQKATEMQKALARFEIIKETLGSQGALGDAIRTADSFANRMRAMDGAIKEAQESAGKILIPVMAKLAGFIISVTEAFNGLSDSTKEIIVSFGAVFVGMTALGAIIPVITSAFTALSALFLSNPFGLAVLGIVALVSAYDALTESQDELADSIEQTKNKFESSTNIISHLQKQEITLQEELVKAKKKGNEEQIKMKEDLLKSTKDQLSAEIVLQRSAFDQQLKDTQKFYNNQLKVVQGFYTLKADLEGKNGTINKAVAPLAVAVKTGSFSPIFQNHAESAKLLTEKIIPEAEKKLASSFAELSVLKADNAFEKLSANVLKVGDAGVKMGDGVQKGVGKSNTEIDKMKDKAEGLEEAFVEKISGIVEKIGDLKAQIKSANDEFEKAFKTEKQDIAGKYVAELQAIKDLQKEIAGEDNSAKRAELGEKLAKMQIGIAKFEAENKVGLSEEIKKAEEDAQKSSFQLAVENFNIKIKQMQEEHDKKIELMNLEIAQQEVNLAKEKAIFEAKGGVVNKYKDVYTTAMTGIKNSSIDTATQAQKALASLQSSLAQIKALTAPTKGEDKRTLTDVAGQFGITNSLGDVFSSGVGTNNTKNTTQNVTNIVNVNAQTNASASEIGKQTALELYKQARYNKSLALTA